jgi:hypothetical protein
LTQILHEWAGEDVLLRADHFFWLLGSAVQKTAGGLLRSLLHSALLGISRSDVPNKLEAIKTICALRPQIDAHGVWSRSNLRDVLIRLTSVSGVKIFFLIDALDECEPQDNLGDLATEILWISQLPNVKLCVSHRPWAVFTRNFEHAPILYLDRLTLRDMENYVRDRLTGVEADVGRYSDFHDQTQPTQQLIRNLANAAEGVFLWTELITKAICSEMRKGKRGEQLVQVMADFPTGLDEYFHKLIFGRIGRSSRNIKDTAAALKLAVKINALEQNPGVLEMPGSGEKSPFAKSFVNFWLLSDDRLQSGFSWQEYERIVQPSTEFMLSQTASFLEETCKDLLVLNQTTRNVDFLHRTVSDFLTDKYTDASLEKEMPAHFSDGDFVLNLAKLRCVCILREPEANSHAVASAFDHILLTFQQSSHLDANASWLLTCGSLTILQMQKVGYRATDFFDDGMPARCVKAGLGKTVMEIYKYLPSLVHSPEVYELDTLGEILHAATRTDIRSPDLLLYRWIMEQGCNPNAHTQRWPHWWSQRYPFDPEDRDLEFNWCARTTWQAWLGEAYLQIQRRGEPVDAASTGQVGNMLNKQKQWLGALVDLLLRYGADPHCMICVTDHEQEPAHRWDEDPKNCRYVALEWLLEQIVPADSTVQIRKLRSVCSDARTSFVLRTNQQKRAIRSLSISEWNLSKVSPSSPTRYQYRYTKIDLQKCFLHDSAGVKNLKYSICNGCSKIFEAALATWCVECQGLASLCLDCCLLKSSEVPGLVSPCNSLTAPRGPRNDDHTSVVFVWESNQFRYEHGSDQAMKDYADLLHERYPTDQAITVLKDWYSKNPIEPDLTFEEAIRDITTLPVPFQPYQFYPDGMAGRSPSEFRPAEAASSQEVATSGPIAPMDATTLPIDTSATPEKVSKRSLRVRFKQKFLS